MQRHQNAVMGQQGCRWRGEHVRVNADLGHRGGDRKEFRIRECGYGANRRGREESREE